MVGEIIVGALIFLVAIPLLFLAALQRIGWVRRRCGPWVEDRANRISPQVGEWFRVKTD